MLMLAYDKMAVSPLDFSTRLNAFKDVCDKEVLGTENYDQLIAKIDEALALADSAYQKVQEANSQYLEALDSKDEQKINEVLNSYQQAKKIMIYH